MATSSMDLSGSRVVKCWSARLGLISQRTTAKFRWFAVQRMYSTAMPAKTGIKITRLSRRRPIGRGPRSEKKITENTTNISKKAVPQRGCSREKPATVSGVSSAPASKALIVLCSAPW